MVKTIQNNLAKMLVLLVAFFAMVPSASTIAQPYCSSHFENGSPYTNVYWYDFFSYFARVSMQKSTTPTVDEYARNTTLTSLIPPADRGTGREQYKHTQNPEINMKIGNNYQFRLNVHGWGSTYTRMFIDLNGDGDFLDVVNGVSEYRGSLFNSHGFTYNFSLPYPDYYVNTNRVVTFSGVNIPCTATPITKSRIRFLTSYAYNNGNNACLNGFAFSPFYHYVYGEVEDYDFNIVPDAPNSFPAEGTLMYAKEDYDGTTRLKDGNNVTFTKPTMYFASPAPVGTTIKCRIEGPLPSTNTVWTALDPNNGSDVVTLTSATSTYAFARSSGVLFDNLSYSPGNNGTFNARVGGEYRIVIEVGGAGCPGAVIRNFTAALDYDLAARAIVSPRSNLAPSFLKYQNNSDIKIIGQYINVGMNPVKKFKAIARIYRPDGVLSREYVRDYDDAIPPFTTINPGQAVEVDFGATFRTNATGVYRMEIGLEWVPDQGEYNNTFPRSDAPSYPFEIQYDIQVAAKQILAPLQNEKIIANRPYTPRGEFINYGISPVSNVNVGMIVSKVSTGEIVYSNTRNLEDISSGRYNTSTMDFTTMVITEPGMYKSCIWINDANDPIRSDDTTCVTFEVESGIQGTFTVGNAKETATGYKVDRNFATIGELMDALYYDGLSGSTVIEFTDAEYTLTAPNETAPAWDFSSRIIGLGMNDLTKQLQTLTFRPAITRAAVKGGVNIKLQAASGVGVLFGQNLFPTNMNAIVRSFPSKQNANAAGYITFDGGNQKTIKFELDVLPKASATSQISGAAIYMGRGTENITVKNCLIETVTPQIKNRVNIPNIVVTANGTRYDRDEVLISNVWQSYSAGIVSRSTLVPLAEQAQLGLDTLANKNNVITGNEITKFGYGIVTLGAGPLFDVDAAVFRRYYNNNNKYENNLIYDVTRAGMLVGYEENSSIKANRIHTVTGTGSTHSDAAGIMLGGQGNVTVKGYNNINLTVDGNEISGVTSSVYAAGIEVEQVTATFGTGNNITSFPNVAENLSIMNNVVWGINTTTSAGVRAGIHLFTERANPTIFSASNWITPRVNNYFSRNDKVVNNTVIIESGSNPQVSTNGGLVGIGIQSASNTEVRNNAVAILDQNINNTTALAGAAILYQGVRTTEVNAAKFDRNAYYTGVANPLSSNISLVRHIEVRADNQAIISAGAFNEYLTLEQWQAASKQDNNSIVGDFTLDMVKGGVAPFNYTVKSNPTPLGSILNNRGERLSYVSNDITGVSRGVAGQRYDIGAVEFAGRTNLSDVEMLSIVEPRSYQAATGSFADAQYIMTKNPVNVVGNIRNNGSLLQTEMEVTVNIYRQNADGVSFPTTPMLTKKVKATVASSESILVDFALATGSSDDFRPKTYFELTTEGYTAPSMFTAMRANVTPIYRVEMAVEADQNNGNNVVTKDLRFYIQKTARELMISAENLSVDLDNPGSDNNLMARLNYNYVVNGMTNINYRLRLNDVNNPVYDYDVFDRNSWEPRAVNYGEYAFLFYADGNGSQMSRTQVEDIQRYMALGSTMKKRNFVACSQELAQWTSTNYPLFARNILRTEYLNNNPNGNGTSYNDGIMVGDQLAKTYQFTITNPINPNTQAVYPGDLQSFPAVVRELNSYVEGVRTINLPGLASPGIRYSKNGSTSDISAVVSSTLETNSIYVGADWRHISNVGILMRGIISYFETNGSVVIPVELTDFTPKQIGNKVAVTWETSSETNTSLFEVEKAEVFNGGVSVFNTIATKEAAGFSKTTQFYGPVLDNEVNLGQTYAYRLKTIDRDGSVQYSDEKLVTLTSESGLLSLGNASPNPAVSETSLELVLSESNLVEVLVYDLNGNVVSKQTINGVNGRNLINLNLVNVSNGAYTAVVRVGEVTLTRNINILK